MADVTDDRAVSPVFGYVLTLSIATLLVGGLLISAGGFVDDQRRNTAESELRVVGQQVSADIAAADRLARTDGAENISVERTIPNDVVGSTYTIEVVDGDGPTTPHLELSASDPDVTVVVGIASKTQVSTGSNADGGRIVVEYDGAANEVVLHNG